MSTEPKTFLTPEQYREIERKAEYKSEYYKGEMFAMAGGTSPHALLAVQTLRLLGNALEGRDCLVYNSDMRVLINSTGLYTYPDASVVCGEPRFFDDVEDTLLNPGVIIEVLSPSTEAYDRGRKFEHYREIPSFRHYVLISSDRVHVDLYTRGEDGRWMLTSASGPAEVIDLTSVNCSLCIADLYAKTKLLAST